MRRACCTADAPLYTNADGQTQQVFYQHDLLANGTNADFNIIDASPFKTPTKRYSGFIQDQWRIIPTLTINAGVRYDSEQYFGLDPITGPFEAFSLKDQWAPRAGFVWDFVGRRHVEAVRLDRPLLLRDPDGPERPRVHGQLRGHHLQLRPDSIDPGPDRSPRPALPGRQRGRRAGRRRE